MSNYNFMKTGLINYNINENDILNIGSIFVVLIENAMKFAKLYVKHAKRNTVTEIDTIKALKLEITVFLKRNNILERSAEIIQEYKSNNQGINPFYKIYNIREKTSNFMESKCICYLCENMNNIDKIWSNWKAETDLEKILKENVEKL